MATKKPALNPPARGPRIIDYFLVVGLPPEASDRPPGKTTRPTVLQSLPAKEHQDTPVPPCIASVSDSPSVCFADLQSPVVAACNVLQLVAKQRVCMLPCCLAALLPGLCFLGEQEELQTVSMVQWLTNSLRVA